MTSLASQLARLSVPQTQVAASQDRRRVSLLFDPKEAASIDREAVFALGVSGLEDLQNLDPQFLEYEGTLFNLTSQDWDRSMQTAEVNEQLDKTIREFLIRLSPFIMLQSAHKALEWLIYRHHIHHYNVDDILTAFLPYCETKIFARIIQILPLDKPSGKWHWLQPAAKGGVPVLRSIVVNHCSKDMGFLSFTCDIVPKFIEVHGRDSPQLRVVTSFLTCCLLSVVQAGTSVSEALVAVLVPNIIRGIKSKCTEYKIGCYMVLSQLVVQTRLKEAFLTSLVPVLTKYMSVSASKEALLCLTLLYQTQPIDHLPKKSFKHVCKVPAIVPLLTNLTEMYDMTNFLKALLGRLVPAALRQAPELSSSSGDSTSELGPERPQYCTILARLLQDVTLSPALAENVTADLLQGLLGGSTVQDDDWRNVVQLLLSPIERRYSDVMDKVVEKHYSRLGDTSEVDALLAITAGGLRYSHVPNTEVNLTLGLNHASPVVRQMALQHLRACVQPGGALPQGLNTDVIMTRLLDDNPQVVQSALALLDVLDAEAGQDVLMDKLIILAKHVHKNPQWEAVTKAIATWISDNKPEAIFDLLPLMIVSMSEEKNILFPKTIMKRFLDSKNSPFKSLAKAWLDHCSKLKYKGKPDWSGLSKLNVCLVSGLADILNGWKWTDVKAQLLKLMKTDGSDRRHLLVVLTMFGFMLQKQKTVARLVDLASVVLKMLITLLADDQDLPQISLNEGVGTETLMMEWLEALETANMLHLQVVSWLMRQLLEAVHGLAGQLPVDTYWSLQDPLVRLTVETLSILVQFACNSKSKENKDKGYAWNDLISNLLMHHLSQEQTCKLLCLAWTEEDVLPSTRIAALYLMADFIKKTDASEVLTTELPLLPCLIAGLTSPQMQIRKGALTNFAVIKSASGKDGPLAALVKKIVKRQDEIQSDPDQVPYVFSVVFTRETTEKKTPRKKRESMVKGTGVFVLLDHAVSPDMPAAIREKMLASLAEVPHSLLIDKIVPFGIEYLSKIKENPSDITKTDLQIIQHIIVRVDETQAETINKESILNELLMKSFATKVDMDTKLLPQRLAIVQITKDLFHNIPSLEVQQGIVSAILDVVENASNPALAGKAQKTLKQIQCGAQHIKQELGPILPKDSSVKGRKAARKSVAEPPLSWRRISVLLEVLQGRRLVDGSEELVSLLFSLLLRLLREEERENTEYQRHLVLSCMHSLTTAWIQHDYKPQQENINIEALVQCIRLSSSPQTQQQALLVMSSVAHFFPDYILHNVMSIFTFVGGGLLQQDDSHSFQVITHTIRTIIPAILKASDESSTDLQQLIASIMQVFIDARHAVPRHRCLMVFHTLVSTLDPDQYLWMVLTLLMTRAVGHKDNTQSEEESNKDGAEDDQGGIQGDVELGINISEQFAPVTQVKAIMQMLDFLQKLTKAQAATQSPRPGRAGPPKKLISVVDVSSLSAQELRKCQFHLTRLNAAILANEAFVTKVVSQMEYDESSMQEELPDFQGLVREALCYVTTVAKASGSGTQTSGMARFWKAQLGKTYEILDKVAYLLRTDLMLDVMLALLGHDMASVRRKALDLLSVKLQSLDNHQLSGSETQALVSLLNALVVLIQDHRSSSDSEVIAGLQMALFCLKLLIKILGPAHTNELIRLYSITTEMLSSGSLPALVVGSCLLCIAELCSTLKAQSIPHLPRFVPPLLAVLRELPAPGEADLLLTCGLTALQRLVTSLPHFLSPYLLEILLLLCQLSSSIGSDENKAKHQPSIRLKAVKHHLVTVVQPRVLVPALGQCWNKLVDDGRPAGLSCVVEMLEEHVTQMSKEDLSGQHHGLLTFYCQMLNIRNQDTSLSAGDLDRMEGGVISAVLAMVVRLSETTFRPMFYKLYDWACREDSQPARNRQLTFFRLCDSLAAKLKSLFNLFVRHTLQKACDLLDKNNNTQSDSAFFADDDADKAEKACKLLHYMLGCLQKCMEHDTEGLFQKDVFTMLLQPLVNQIENFTGGESHYEERMTGYVVPCLSQFAVASRDDASWKSLNYQILLKTRHASAKVRFGALQVCEAVAQKLGEDYMVLLPETIPFLAELMEDESEEVEQQCQHVISTLESVLGESLQKYF